MTPFEAAPRGLADGRRVFLKREDTHELGAFKWRGALPTVEMYQLRGAKRVVTASTGNHGAATAWAARKHGIGAVVFAPVGASRAKLELIARQGAEIREQGTDFDDAKAQYAAFKAMLLDLNATKAAALMQPLIDGPTGSLPIRERLKAFAAEQGLQI